MGKKAIGGQPSAEETTKHDRKIAPLMRIQRGAAVAKPKARNMARSETVALLPNVIRGIASPTIILMLMRQNKLEMTQTRSDDHLRKRRTYFR